MRVLVHRYRQGQPCCCVAVLQGNWGVGMMAMPYMLDRCGPISGVIMFIASMALTQFSILNLL